MADALPQLSREVCARLRAALTGAGYDADGVVEFLGSSAHAALGRGETEPAFRATSAGGPLATFIRLFLLGAAQSRSAAAEAFAPLALEDAMGTGLVRAEGDRVRAGLDVRPHADEQGSWWVLSDMEHQNGSAGREHVIGLGQAALSLVRATSRHPVTSFLDLGTGNGVQALHASRHASSITATDVSARALALAEGTFLLNDIDVELRHGAWFTPVARRRFEQIACNPPFVIGPARVDYTYQDSGLDGDEASALVVRQLPSFLEQGGTGHVLASWLHTDGQDWSERVADWVPEATDAWFVQRDVTDPAHYVGTWLRDAGLDPASPEGRAKAGVWLDWFAEADVDAIGFGFVTLRRIDETSEPTVLCEDMRQSYDDPLGTEAAGWLDRVSWLRSGVDLLNTSFAVPDSVVLEQTCTQSEQGWLPLVRTLRRTDGPGWQHEVDELAAALLAGCRGHLPLSDLIELLALAHDEPTDALVETALPIVRQLVLHGMLLPAELGEHGG